MVIYVTSDLQTNVFNLIILVIKAFTVNSEFGLYIKLLSIKVYIIAFAKKLIRVIYLSVVLYVYNVYI
jgi:hypothetical protein